MTLPITHPRYQARIMTGYKHQDGREYSDPSTPYERAVRRVERYTGVSREHWEGAVNHPYGRAAIKLARYFAGLVELPDPTRRSRGFQSWQK